MRTYVCWVNGRECPEHKENKGGMMGVSLDKCKECSSFLSHKEEIFSRFTWLMNELTGDVDGVWDIGNLTNFFGTPIFMSGL